VAEWSIAPVLKTGKGKPFVSSNLTASANKKPPFGWLFIWLMAGRTICEQPMLPDGVCWFSGMHPGPINLSFVVSTQTRDIFTFCAFATSKLPLICWRAQETRLSRVLFIVFL
jgi:hypothetical protein